VYDLLRVLSSEVTK